VFLRLFATRRFQPLFWAQFLGAFNDNFYRNALILLILYRLAGDSGPIIVAAAAGIFILPFFLFSATAGAIADRIDKACLARHVKLAEIVIAGLGGLALFLGNIPFLLSMLFLFGAQSAVFGPVKYGILPELLDRAELMAGNAMIAGATFAAILLGTIAAGLLVLAEHGLALVTFGMLALAIVGWWASRRIPEPGPAAPGLAVEANILAAIRRIVVELFAEARVGRATLLVSWFWFVGAIFLSQIPAYTRDHAGGDERVVTLFLALFTIGIGMGAVIAARTTRGRIELRPVPLGALGMAIFAIDLWFATAALPSPSGETFLGLADFLGNGASWRVMVDLAGLAMAGGVFVVPAFTAIQAWAEPARRARVIAAVNIVNAGFMVASSLATMALLGAGLEVVEVFLALGIANLVIAGYALRLAPNLLPAFLRR